MGDLSKDLIASDALVPSDRQAEGHDGWHTTTCSAARPRSSAGTASCTPTRSPTRRSPSTSTRTCWPKAGQKIDPATLTWDQVAAAGAAVTGQDRQGGLRDPRLRLRLLEHAGHGLDRASARSAWSADGKHLRVRQPGDAARVHVPARRRLHDQVRCPAPARTPTSSPVTPPSPSPRSRGRRCSTGRSSTTCTRCRRGRPASTSVLGQAGVGVLPSSKHPDAGDGLPRLPDEPGERGEARAVLPAAAHVAADRRDSSPRTTRS